MRQAVATRRAPRDRAVEIVPEDFAGPARGRALHHVDRRVGERERRIEGTDRRVVPARDATQVDGRERVGVEVHGIADGREIDHDGDGAGDREHLDRAAARPRALLGAERTIGRAEVDVLIEDEADALARADGEVVDPYACRVAVLREPPAVEWIRERRAGADEVDAARGRRRRRGARLDPLDAGGEAGEQAEPEQRRSAQPEGGSLSGHRVR